MSTTLKGLKGSRSSLKGRMTGLVNYLDTITMITDVEDLKVRLASAESYLNQFSNIESQIFDKDENEASEIEEFEQKYFLVTSTLNQWIRKHGLSDNFTFFNSSSATQSEVKLPKIQIPSFSGSYTEWLSFHDLFTSTIHANPNIKPVQKFQYLKSFLKGEAASLLNHLPVSDASYVEAFQKLCQRYDHKKHTVNAFIKTFVNQPSIKIADATNIRKMLDTSDEVVRGLKAISTRAESRDPWLIFMLLNKLDVESQKIWSQTSTGKDFPELKEFFKFLTDRADALESINDFTRHTTSVKPTTIRGMIATSSNKCSICEGEHFLSDCPKFQSMQVKDRKEFVKESNRCFNCLSPSHGVFHCMSRKRCTICKRKHNSLLHESTQESSAQQLNVNTHVAAQPQPNHSEPITSSTHSDDVVSTNCTTANCYQTSNSLFKTILPTAIVRIKNSQGKFLECCCLLDSGSQASFATESLIQRLNLTRKNARISISGIGQAKAGVSRGITILEMQSTIRPEKIFKIQALIVDKVTSTLPSAKLNTQNWHYLNGLNLADPTYGEPKKIDLLIGADHFFNLLDSGKIVGDENQPIAQNTMLGWIVSGTFSTACHDVANTTTVSNFMVECDVDKTLRRFWELEEVYVTKGVKTSEETLCEDHFVLNTKRLADGRFCVRLPFKSENPQIGSSLYIAVQRQKTMERRFQTNPEFADMYKSFMKEYEDLGHMKKLLSTEIVEDGYYLPHHGVLKDSSSTTKLRVVFDASAKTTMKTSLNENLLIGPVVQDSLYNILMRFRKYEFVLIGDIEKMYRQIWVDTPDTKYQKIVWRSDISKQMEHYKLLTVTYGTSSAPFLATRSLKQLSLETSDPYLAKIIENDIYVDDVMTGTNSKENLKELKSALINTFSKAGFNLRKFASNSNYVLSDVPIDNFNINSKLNEENSTELKVLGLQWNSRTDNFKFIVNLETVAITTKRKILSESSRIFDPLGWLAPAIVKVKIFFQNLWLLKLEWDEDLPHEHKVRWLTIRSELKELESISIPRWLNSTNNEIELHGFCDASQLAYAAAVYCRLKNKDGNYLVKLITAKTKVAPIKQISIPRLELCGALLLSKLLKAVQSALDMKIDSITAWTDSTIVLDWLSDRPSKWKTFVGNRTSEILQELNRDAWRHVRSGDNPADCASRGISPIELANNTLWWDGPIWLSGGKESWPQESYVKGTTDDEMRPNITTCLLVDVNKNEFLENFINKYSNYNKILNILAYLFRFIYKSRKTEITFTTKNVVPDEVKRAELYILKYQQDMFFSEERAQLKKHQEVSKGSPIKNMNPFIDEFGLIRMGGRIENSQAQYDTRHPIILSSNGSIIEKLVRNLHIKYKHAGITLLVNISRQRFWILRCHDIARKIVNACIICCRHRGKTEEQIMADLPASRVEFDRPFLKVGIDYAGPFSTLLTRRRGQRPQKIYICVFVCFTTRAVHIELVNDMSTDAFLAALRRFVSRRGLCTDIYSDNGLNFVGANNDLRKIYSDLEINQNLISRFLLADKINWHFNPPSAPNFGGLFEAAIKSMKFHLKRVIGESLLTMDEMNTLLTEVEAIMNSRPICAVSSNDVDALTPGHFLIGCQMTAVPERSLQEIKLSYNERWKMVQQLTQHFWKRWCVEYLTSLQMRNKWLNIKRNLLEFDIVLIKNENLPPTKWLLGRILEVFYGSDKRVRVVDVKTADGKLRRPVNKLVLLPIESTDSRPSENVPECSRT